LDIRAAALKELQAVEDTRFDPGQPLEELEDGDGAGRVDGSNSKVAISSKPEVKDIQKIGEEESSSSSKDDDEDEDFDRLRNVTHRDRQLNDNQASPMSSLHEEEIVDVVNGDNDLETAQDVHMQGAAAAGFESDIRGPDVRVKTERVSSLSINRNGWPAYHDNMRASLEERNQQYQVLNYNVDHLVQLQHKTQANSDSMPWEQINKLSRQARDLEQGLERSQTNSVTALERIDSLSDGMSSKMTKLQIKVKENMDDIYQQLLVESSNHQRRIAKQLADMDKDRRELEKRMQQSVTDQLQYSLQEFKVNISKEIAKN
jgi:hypothetical protein